MNILENKLSVCVPSINHKDTTMSNSESLLNQVIEQLKETDFDDLIVIHNNYADENSYENIYHNDEMTINDIFTSPYDAIRKTNNDGYNDNDNYFTFNGYGYMSSFSSLSHDNCPIDIDDLAQWIIDNESYDNYNLDITLPANDDDKHNAIMDNLEDSSSLDDIIKVLDHLNLPYDEFDFDNESPAEYESHLIATITDHVYNDTELLDKTILFMKIDI